MAIQACNELAARELFSDDTDVEVCCLLTDTEDSLLIVLKRLCVLGGLDRRPCERRGKRVASKNKSKEKNKHAQGLHYRKGTIGSENKEVTRQRNKKENTSNG